VRLVLFLHTRVVQYCFVHSTARRNVEFEGTWPAEFLTTPIRFLRNRSFCQGAPTAMVA
jgi:hypothetical protein